MPMGRMKKAEITAFLSMVFVLLVSFVLGMLEISVIQTSGNMSRLAVDRAVFSIFGEYQSQMFQDYHIFAIDGSYGTGEFSEENLADRMHYYGTAGMEHEITGIQYLTDDSGQAFREQVLEYMETKYGISLVQDFTGLTAKWEEESIQGDEMEEKQQGIMEEVQDIRQSAADAAAGITDVTDTGNNTGNNAGNEKETVSEMPSVSSGGENTDVDIIDGDPFTCLEQIEKSGILSVVMPEQMELSGLQVDLQAQASNRELTAGRGTFPKRQGTDGIEERLLFNEYILMNFSNAAQYGAQNGTDTSDTYDVERERSLAYETEYILEGKASDKENLESVLMKIFLIRMALNYVYLMGDSAKQAEVTALSVAVTTVLLIPEAAEVVKQLILLAWSAGESVVDIRTLLSGKRAALVKSSDNWQLPLSGLLTFGSGSQIRDGEDVPGGITYEEYLRAFLFLKGTDDITMRTIDRMEENLAMEHGMDHIRADQCVTKLETENTAQIFGGLTYTFPAYFGYE